jgi:hypothetical protein
MRFITFKDRCTVIQELDEASNRLLPFWRFSHTLGTCTLCACLLVFWPFSFINASSQFLTDIGCPITAKNIIPRHAIYLQKCINAL